MIYGLLGIMLIVFICIVFLLCDIHMKLIEIEVKTSRTKDIVTKWATHYVIEEWNKGNNAPFDFIFPNNREIIEERMRQEERHIDSMDILV